jgi:hypothetical protein
MVLELLNELFDSTTLKTASFVDKLSEFHSNSEEDNPTITRDQFIALVSHMASTESIQLCALCPVLASLSLHDTSLGQTTPSTLTLSASGCPMHRRRSPLIALLVFLWCLPEAGVFGLQRCSPSVAVQEWQ